MRATTRSLIVVAVLSACGAPQGDLHVAIPPHIAAAAASALAAAPPRNVALPPFADPILPPGRIGTRGNNSAGAVIIDPPPGQLLHDAFAAELRKAGDTIRDEAGVTIDGHVIAFSLTLVPGSVDWQMRLEANVAVSAHSDQRTVNHAYATRCDNRSYTRPDADDIARLVGHCIDDLARQFRSDADIAQVLGAP